MFWFKNAPPAIDMVGSTRGAPRQPMKVGRSPSLPSNAAAGLAEGAYDMWYADENGRHVGEEGFLPPGKTHTGLHPAH